jgi:hypothetical protein
VILLRRTDPSSALPGAAGAAFPVLGVVFCVALMLNLPIETWIRFFAGASSASSFTFCIAFVTAAYGMASTKADRD